MNGLAVLVRKELLESWRTFRLPVAAGLFLFTGISSPLIARFLPEIIELAAGDQMSGIPIPPPTVALAVDQFVRNMAQFGGLAAILLAMSMVAAEKDRGTAAFILVKPVTRAAFLTAKLIVLGAVLGIATLVAVLVAWIYTALLFEPLPVAGWVWLGVLVWLSLSAYAVITFLGSTLTGSTAAAAGIGFGALIVLSIIAAIPGLGRYTPAGLLQPATALGTGTLGPADLGTDLLIPVVASIVIIAGGVLAAYWSFRRQEL
jgi:ABC-2 type transport system permease protein